MVVGPHTPDLARSLSDLKDEAKENNWPTELKAALIGSCTNSSYEDMERAASIAQQALDAGLVSKTPFLVTPGSDQIDQTIRRDGQMEVLSAIGGTVLANACGPCIGQWHREDVDKGTSNSIVSSFNRNFPGRNDGNAETLSFIKEECEKRNKLDNFIEIWAYLHTMEQEPDEEAPEDSTVVSPTKMLDIYKPKIIPDDEHLI